MKTRLDKWAEKTFDPPPSRATLNRMARNGQIPGCEKIGKYWYVTERKSPLLEKILDA